MAGAGGAYIPGKREFPVGSGAFPGYGPAVALIFTGNDRGAFIILMIDPNNAFSIGLWLSFAAVTSIIVVYPMLTSFNIRFLPFRYVYNTMAVTLSAQIGTMPLTLMFFHSFPVYFLLHNVVVLPLVAPILIGAITVVLFSFSETAVSLMVPTLDSLLCFVSDYVESAAALPYSVVTGVPFDAVCALASAALLISVVRFATKPHFLGLRPIMLCACRGPASGCWSPPTTTWWFLRDMARAPSWRWSAGGA